MTAILQDCMLNVAAVATRSVLIVWDKSCSFCTVETPNSEPGFGTWDEGFGGGNVFYLHRLFCSPHSNSIDSSANMAFRSQESELNIRSRR
jgi:hypothetical protein